ncbi:MAG: prepilin-type N-terminal cleavage/methylation domain-containing protein [Luteolibacter sp.]|uniref:pilus assembly FimT family protein n=1 Tax=Luteolibacter sp. TaxID=1962973 RepID=UPI0032670EC4
MDFSNPNFAPSKHHRAFTLIEMLVVIAIMSILMTAGAIGLGGMGGKGVSSGVATAESLFDEARAVAVGQRTRARVLISHDLTNSPAENLRRIVVANAEVDPATGKEKTPLNWVLSSRPQLLPDQVYFSETYSVKDQKSGSGALEEMTLSTGVKAPFAGKYFYYEFNAEGISTTPGASFVIGNGSRGLNSPTDQPRVTSSGKRDFGGFVIWRNGRTSLFRSPAQISKSINDLKTGDKF